MADKGNSFSDYPSYIEEKVLLTGVQIFSLRYVRVYLYKRKHEYERVWPSEHKNDLTCHSVGSFSRHRVDNACEGSNHISLAFVQKHSPQFPCNMWFL
jgi:hypothetical protein